MKVEKLSNNRVKYTFDVTPEEFEMGLSYAFDRIKKDVEIKGFRKGHVTRKVYENKFGVESLYEEALNFVFHNKYHEMLEDKTYEVVGEPVPFVDFETISTEKAFVVTLEAPVKPEVTLGEYKGIEVAKKDLTVDLDEVNERIDNMLNENVTYEPKEEGELELGDLAVFDFEGSVDGELFEGGTAENYELEIGSNQFIPGFEDQMVGMRAGDVKDVDVTFPEEYHEPALAGQPAVFKVTLHDIKVRVTNELTDEWVKSLGGEEQTVTELKGKVQVDIKKAKENENRNKALNEALEKLAETSQVDIPEEMIDYEVKTQKDRIAQQASQYGMDYATYVSLVGMSEEQLEAQIREDSQYKVMNSLLIEAVAAAEKFEATPEELEEKYQEIADSYQMSVEEVKGYLNDEMVTKDILFSKAIDFIYDNLKFI